MDQQLYLIDYNEEWDENTSFLQNRYDLSDEMRQELNKDFIELDNKKCYMNIFGKKQNIMKADLFYCNLYEYYYRGGFLTIILSYVLEIFSLIFGIHFMIFIFILLDWNKILQCGKENDIQDCGEIFIYINPQYPNFFCFLFLVFAGLFTFYKISLFLSNYKYILITRDFFENKLKISSSELQTMKWYNIIKKISSCKNISVEDITNIILKKENYIIALINENIINISPSLYTKQLELNLKYILLSDIENINKIKNIKIKFILLGILNCNSHCNSAD